MNFLINVAIAIWITSSAFMLFFHLNAQFTLMREKKTIIKMPLGFFLAYHFLPIYHTYNCFKIMKRYSEKKS